MFSGDLSFIFILYIAAIAEELEQWEYLSCSEEEEEEERRRWLEGGEERGGFGRREGEWGMKLPEGEVWLVFIGCGADRLRSVCMHAVSPGIDGLCL